MRTKTPLFAERMLDAAARLFARQRFHEVRMEDIAAEAEVGKGTIYRYFSDKDELYVALVERASQQFLGRLQDVMRPEDAPRARLVSLVDAIIEFFDEQPHLFDLIQRAEVLKGPGFPWQKVRQQAIELVTEALRELKSDGGRVRDPELTTLLLLGGVRAVVRFGKRPRTRDLAERIVVVYLHE